MNSSDDRSPMARGMGMVGRVMAASMMMVLPGLGGQWLDRKLGTCLLVLVGFALGITVSIYYLLLITSVSNDSDEKKQSGK